MNRLLSVVLTLLVLVAVHPHAMANPAAPLAALMADRVEVRPGESVTVGFTSPGEWPGHAWVGLFPAELPIYDEVEADKHEITYQYIRQRTSGDMVFTMPRAIGAYQFRMYGSDNENVIMAAKSPVIRVTDAPSTALGVNKSLVAPGEAVQVAFTAPGDWPAHAWVGLFKADVPVCDETEADKHDLSYQYMDRQTSGIMTFTMPTTPGPYRFRMYGSDTGNVPMAAQSGIIEVTENTTPKHE